MRYFLRVEAVNLGSFVYDCHDLSVIRGGGLLLLDAIQKLKTTVPGLKAISTGASAGLFHFDTEESPDRMCESVREVLSRSPLSHATFLMSVGLLAKNEDFSILNEKLIAKIRFNQMQYPSLRYPHVGSKLTEVCFVDHVRPAATDGVMLEDGRREKISHAVNDRRVHGRRARQTLYQRSELKELPQFTDDLKQLAAQPGHPLDGKIAVIYVDGNQFGRVAREKCKTQALLEQWDQTVQNKMNAFLKALLQEIQHKPEWLSVAVEDGKQSSRLRLETLLWGGDERMWVVPARFGWWLLQFFFQQNTNWVFERKTNGRPEYIPLTSTASIVYCSHKAPIHAIRRLTGELVDLVKLERRDEFTHKPEGNQFTYLVLESFDDTGRPLEQILKDRRPPGCDFADSVLPGQHMAAILPGLLSLKKVIPHGQLYGIVSSLLSKKTELVNEAKDRMTTYHKHWDATKLKDKIDESMTYVHLLELWDYLDG